MEFIRNKKGIFFTSLALVAITLFFVTYTFYDQIERRESTEQRIVTMNNFLKNVQADLSRQLYIAGFRSIFLIESKIVSSGQYASNVSALISENFISGTYEGESEILFQGATFSEIELGLREKAQTLNINLSLSNPELRVSQENPWEIKLELFTTILIQDKTGLASWNITEPIIASVSIEHFDDPLYIIETQGKVVNRITKTPYTAFVSNTDVSNLTAHAQNSYYLHSTEAPSFIDRLQGSLSANLQGIESLVNIQNLSQQGVEIEQKSIVDHIYFSSSNPSSYQISGTPSWLRLDNSHLLTYNASGLTI